MAELLNGYRCDATADPEGAEVEKVRCQFFPERTDLPYVNMEDVVCIVATVTGVDKVRFTGTGGNCAAVIAEGLEGGDYLMVTDADVFVESGGTWQSFYGSWTVGVYPFEECDTRFMAFGPAYDCSGEALIDTLKRALGGATDHLAADGTEDYRPADPSTRGQ